MPMPVHIDSHHRDRSRPSHLSHASSEPLTIGLINNMPDLALQSTERQFVSLLDAASEGIPIALSLYSLPGTATATGVALHGSNSYASVETLRNTRLDGLIVTGREPMTPNLRDEPYWRSFTKVVDWARDNTYSTIWSCLAAHAAVLHMDGIARRSSPQKHCGVFECSLASDHPLTAGTGPRFNVPHSRWNGVAEEDLAARGYQILTRTGDAEVDIFIKQENSLFAFFQGHPEYESDTLLREYRRDVARYLGNEISTYPSVPRSYLDHATEHRLTTLREQAISPPAKNVFARVTTAVQNSILESMWRAPAIRIYRNWLEYISERKQANRQDAPVNAEYSASR